MKTLKHIPPSPPSKGGVAIAIAFILGMGIQQNAHADLKDGLVAHWSFDDCRATDNSGNGHDGTLNGNPQCVDGVKGKAFSFDGSKDYVDLTGKPIAQQGNNPRSIFVWCKTTDQKGYQRVVVTGTTGFNQAFNILLWGNGQPGIMGYAPVNDFYANTGTVADGKWHFIGATYDGNISSIWIDGVLKGSKQMTYNTTGNDNFIGRSNDDQTTIETTYFNGNIDDPRIYNRALTEAEVLELYNGGGVVAEKPVLVAEVCSPTQTVFEADGNSGTVSSSAASCVTPSNTLADLVDLEKSSIDYANGKIKVVLKKTPDVGTFGVRTTIDGKTLGDKYFHKGTTIPQEITFDFYPFQNRNGIISVTLSRAVAKGGEMTNYEGTLYGVTDNVQLSDGIGNRAILASRKLSETKPHSGIECKTAQGVSSECNNFFATDEIAAEDSINATFQDTLTHRIVDFDKLVGRVAINNTWAKSTYGTNAYKNKSSTGDNNRIPLLLIHGWQGDKNLRNPAKLGLWQYSELHYWQHFLDYYLTSPALQKKYHLYLYHYPSYKHVTYNASVLNDLLQEVGKNYPVVPSDLGRAISAKSNEPQNSLTIVAHSMGGMVARSMIEEYQGLGNTKVYGSSYASAMVKLNQLITLDTPHHGSTGSDPDPDGVKGAISGALGSVAKDLTSQGATDLNWDNYDNRLSNDKITTNNENYRWAKANTKMFDAVYCAGCKTLNPWLLNMNKQFENNYVTLAKDKYVIYAAWMSSFREDGDDAGNATAINPINNNIDYNIAENVGIPDLPNGVAEPVTSALLSKFDVKTQKTLPFNPECKAEFPTWSVPKQIYYFQDWLFVKESLLPEISTAREDVLCNKSASLPAIQLHSILIPSDTSEYAHPYGLPYRIFWDYDHEKMVNGAYARSLNIFKDFVGSWDQFIAKGVTTSDLKTSAFKSNSLRNNYIYVASSYRGDKPVLAKNPKTVYNPLKTEPLYLILERDLLKK